MERAQIVVIAIVVAALGLFGLKIWSDRTAQDSLIDAEAGGGRNHLSGAGGGLNEPGHGRLDAPGAGGSRRVGGGAGGGANVAGGRAGAGGGAAGLGGQTARSGSAALAGGVGQGAGHRTAIGSGVGGAMADGTRPGARPVDRPDLVDFLGAQKPSGDIGGDPRSGDAEDVALEVKSTDDSAQAAEKRDIDEPEDGDPGIKFTEGSQLKFPDAGNANGDAGTISFDIEPQWKGSDKTDNSLVTIKDEHGFANRLELVKNGRYLRFIVADNEREADISVPIDNWEPGERHSITASWGEARTSLYIDGQLAGSNTYSGTFDIAPGTPLYLGSDYRSSSYGGANATIRDFTLFKNSRHP